MIIRGYSAGIDENIRKPGNCFDGSIRVVEEIRDSIRNGVRNLVFVGSSCMYPIAAAQPYREESLGSGAIERTSESHAYANLAAYAQCRAYSRQYGVNYFTAIQADVYGKPESTHFIGQILKRMHFAKENHENEVIIWGDGSALREPFFFKDADRAIGFVHEHYQGPEPINLGNGKEYSVAHVARLIKEVVGYQGTLTFDCSQPSGVTRKTLDNSKLLAMGFDGFTSLEDGLVESYSIFKNSL